YRETGDLAAVEPEPRVSPQVVARQHEAALDLQNLTTLSQRVPIDEDRGSERTVGVDTVHSVRREEHVDMAVQIHLTAKDDGQFVDACAGERVFHRLMMTNLFRALSEDGC